MTRFWSIFCCVTILCAFCLTAGCCAETGGNSYADSEQAVSGTVFATGDVNLRSGPGLDYDTLGVMHAGQERAYTGKTSVDGRGVAWYSLEYEGGEAWASSKYTYVEASIDDSGEAGELEGVAVGAEIDIPAGTVLTEEQIQATYGVFNFNRTINTTGVEAHPENGRQCFRLNFAPEVYYGGTSGYGERWLSEGGIVAERDVDLDLDGVDEHLVFVLSNKGKAPYYEPYIYCTVAIFEPVYGGFALADSFDFNFDWSGEGPRFVRLVAGERGTYIMDGSIAYWDGGYGGVYAALYGYDGRSAYADLIVNSGTEGSFYLEKRIDADLVRKCWDVCIDYEFMYPEAQAMGISEGVNLHSYNYDLDVPLYDYETEKYVLTRFGGIDACGAAVKPYGFEHGYVLYRRDDGYQTYELLLDGGDELIWAEEGCDPEDWDKAFIDLRLDSTLTHVY